MRPLRSAPRWHTAPQLEAAVLTPDHETVREAQRLRYWLLAAESDLSRTGSATGLDVDGFDEHCDHVVVRDLERQTIVGTYRILAPERAQRLGAYEAECTFDLDLLTLLRERMVEVGRACVHPDYSPGAVLGVMWGSLCRYLIEHGYDYVFTTASVPVADGGHRAASIYRAIAEHRSSPEDLRVSPRERLPLETLRDVLPVAPSALLHAYLELGAWVCGEPGFESNARRAAIPLLMPLARMRGRQARQFLCHAA